MMLRFVIFKSYVKKNKTDLIRRKKIRLLYVIFFFFIMTYVKYEHMVLV